MSLSRTVGRCRGVYFAHEAFPHLSWEPISTEDYDFELTYAAKVGLLQSGTGDVHPAYLPHLPRLLVDVPDLRVVCMERPRPEVVASFMAWTPGMNYWQDHDGSEFSHGAWDRAFPHFAAPDKAAALGQYWDQYYHSIRELQSAYPGQVLTFPTAALSTHAGQRRLFDFLGVSLRDRFYSASHLNQRPGG